MQTLTHQAQQTINYQQQRLSPYMPALGLAIAKTYGLPFGLLLVANVVVNLIIFAVPGLFTGLIGSFASLAIFFALLYYGWRYAENRWRGTSLFIAYTTVSKARRMLEAEINSQNPSDAVIQQYMSDYVKLSDGLIETLHNNNVIITDYQDASTRRKEKPKNDDADVVYEDDDYYYEDLDESDISKRHDS